MKNSGSFLKKSAHTIGGGFLSLLLGIVAGAICGAAILAFGDFIGRSGTTGTEYLGFWDPAAIPVGLFYGGLFGSIMGPLAYALVVREVGFRKAVLPALLGTIAGGFLGAMAAPPLAVVTGIWGFFAAVFWTKGKLNGEYMAKK